MYIHIVVAGENLYKIASYYGVSLRRLMADNGITNPDKIMPGEALLILIPKEIHIVRKGETLYSISKFYAISELKLVQNNPTLIGRPYLYDGEVLVISYAQEKMRDIYVNAFAYPFANKGVIETSLPYLSVISIFSYTFTGEGVLDDINDTWLIELAKSYNVKPMMVISNYSEEKLGFNSPDVYIILDNKEVQQCLIENILKKIKEKGYQGVDVDFENIKQEYTEKLAKFVSNLTTQLNKQGYEVSADLAPKENSEVRGQLYDGHNYKEIGNSSNSAMIMAYEWGYAFSEPMAIAPLDKVSKVVDYGLSQIPSDKLVLGIPNYAYNWIIPKVDNERATTIGNIQAVNIARKYGAEISYDYNAESPYFRYTDENGEAHEVWFEDSRSIFAKLRLADEKGLKGVGYWNAMRIFPQNWAMINALFNIEKQENL